MSLRHWAPALLLFTVGGCAPLTGTDCVAIGVAGVRLFVSDAITGQVPAAVVATITEGTYSDTLDSSGGVYYGAWERTGTYTVAVESPGYARWSKADVRVTRGGSCGYLRQVSLSSTLTRSN